MRGATRLPLYFLKEPWLTSCQGKARNLRGQLFFPSLTNLFSKQPLFSLREILSQRKEKGEAGGGEGAGNPKKIEFINFLYKKSKFYLNNNNLFIYGKEGQEQSYFKEGKRSKSLNLDHRFYDVIKNIVGFKKILSGSMTCSQIWLS